MKRICIFCEKWGAGGIEAFIVNTLEQMNLSDVCIDIVVAEIISNLFTPRVDALGIHIYELSGDPYGLFENLRRLHAMLKERKYDVIHIHAFISVSFIYALQTKRDGVRKIILHSHNNHLRKSAYRLFKVAAHTICKHSLTYLGTDFWACSREAAEFMFPGKLWRQRQVEIVPDGIDTQKFSFDAEMRMKIRKELDISDKFVLGNVGRIGYQKNQEFQIDILHEVRNQQVDAVLLLVGDGDLSTLKANAANQGMLEYVIFYGSSRDVGSLLCAMDVFLFPSRFEGFGIAAVEAQCSGLNTFCSDEVPANVNVTSKYHSIPLEYSAAQWADTILEVMSDSPERSDHTTEICACGYDITTTAEWIYRKYTERFD